MSEYYKLTDEDRVVKLDGDRAYIFDGAVNEWIRDSANSLAKSIRTQDGEHAGNCERISENEARAWIARKADGAE